MVVKQVVRNIWMKHWYNIIICWKQMIYGELRTVQFIASFWKDKIYEEINVETTTYNWSAFGLLLINVEATTYPHQNICLEGAPSLDSNCSHPSAHQCFVLIPYMIYVIYWMMPHRAKSTALLEGVKYISGASRMSLYLLYILVKSQNSSTSYCFHQSWHNFIPQELRILWTRV